MNILHVNTQDDAGGAARIAISLMEASRERGHDARMIVGFKGGSRPEVIELPRQRNAHIWTRASRRVGRALDRLDRRPGVWRLQRLLRTWGRTPRQRHLALGYEDFDHPGSWHLLETLPWKPDIVHLHNLHGGYFDLRRLPSLTREVPVVMTLHDAWLLSGHCAHSFACERWRSGCGQCPDLNIPPPIRRDATAHNWRLKRRLYKRSRLHVATPSEWLMRRVKQSILVHALSGARVIANGVDGSVFRPSADRMAIRDKLGLPMDSFVLLTAASVPMTNPWKDHDLLIRTIELLGAGIEGVRVVCVALGEANATIRRIEGIEVRYVPYRHQVEAVKTYYQAADVYLHPAKVDTFPNAVLEAMACGLPVVATAVGGIPEQIRPLPLSATGDAPAPGWHNATTATGVLVPAGDAVAMADAIVQLMKAPKLRRQLGENAVADVHDRFTQTQMTDAYLDWYEAVVN